MEGFFFLIFKEFLDKSDKTSTDKWVTGQTITLKVKSKPKVWKQTLIFEPGDNICFICCFMMASNCQETNTEELATDQKILYNYAKLTDQISAFYETI